MATKNTATKTPAPAKGKKAKPAPVAEKAPRAKREGLNKACVRVLYALDLAAKKKPGAALSKTRINEVLSGKGSKMSTNNTVANDHGWMFAAVGSNNEDGWAATEERVGYPNLRKVKAIEYVEVDNDGKTDGAYRITAHGKKMLAEALAAKEEA
jgi:hypothetical protein